MAAFYIGSYDIVDPKEFQKYPPIVLALLPKYRGAGAGVGHRRSPGRGINADDERDHPLSVEGAALGLYNDPDYQEAKRIRQASTKNISMVLVDEFGA